jgi:serine/threonine protein kinase
MIGFRAKWQGSDVFGVEHEFLMKSDRSARQSQAVYPPLQLSFPQFVTPFGAADGARAAYRMFVGDRAERFLPREPFSLESLSQKWLEVRGEPWPLPAGFDRQPSFVDLDPQLTTITRGGDGVHFLLAMLISGMNVHSALPAQEREVFESEVGSLWAIGGLDDAFHLQLDAEALPAQLERFREFCQIDPSAKRHLLFISSEARDVAEAKIEDIADEIDLDVHDFNGSDILARLFFAQLDARAHIVFVQPDETLSLLEEFDSIWRQAHHSRESQRTSSELTPGTVLGERYEISRKLGAGGFAVVYEASDVKVERRVAIKVIDLERTTSDEEQRPAYIRRFQREAKLAAQVKHPCIVDVYDVGVIDNKETPYMVMELLEGWDLEQHMRRHGPMPPERLLPLFIQALEGLGCAHEAGIVHKDLKPSNLFLKHPERRHEQLSILDFGVARQVGTDTSRLTRTDSAFGTPHYMAPEYSTNQITTPALDVYQMGLILVEMLMGAPVVTHPEPVAAMFQHVRGDLFIPTRLIESPLGEVLRAALALEYTTRIVDGFAFADALKSVDVKHVPLVSPRDDRTSLNPNHDSSAHLNEQVTPVLGQRRLSTDEYQVAHAPTMDVESLEEEKVREAVTLLADSNGQPLPSARVPDRPPNQTKPPPRDNSSNETSTLPDEGEVAGEELEESSTKPVTETSAEQDADESSKEAEEDDDGVIIISRSPLPYVVITLASIIVAAIAVGAIYLDDPPKKPNVPDEVITDYDRELAVLRERKKRLPEMLERGEIDELLAEVKSMEKERAKLTPSEVSEVQQIVKRANRERLNRVHLDFALDLSQKSEHMKALTVLNEISPDSVFQSHPDKDRVISRATIELTLQSEKLRNMGHLEEAEHVMMTLLAHDPTNSSIRNQLMLIQQDIRMLSEMAKPEGAPFDPTSGLPLAVDMPDMEGVPPRKLEE